MLFMIVEKFHGGDPVPVYRRLRDQGRMFPEGLEYRGSWVEEGMGRCFQLMECQDRSVLDGWIAQWTDLADFEVVPVITSREAQIRVLDEM